MDLPQQEGLAVVKRSQVIAPTEEVFAGDEAYDQTAVFFPQRGNHSDASHEVFSPGVVDGWNNAYHDGHVQWRSSAAAEIMFYGTGSGWADVHLYR